MANVFISCDQFANAVNALVQQNVDENLRVMEHHIDEAARHARDELKKGSGHNAGGKSPRYKGSISGGTAGKPTPPGFYSKGWRVYGRATREEMYERVVANWHAPKLTHLLEFGHAGGGHFLGTDGKMHNAYRRVPGDHAIWLAYRNAAPIAKGGM